MVAFWKSWSVAIKEDVDDLSLRVVKRRGRQQRENSHCSWLVR